MGELKTLARQAGLIRRQQALDCGMSGAAVSRRLASGEWKPVFPGVYRHIAVAVTDRLMLEGALMWLGPAAVVSGSWAAWWHGLREEPVGPVSVTMPRTASAHRHQHVRVRRRNLFAPDISVVRRIPVTSRALTALENAGLVDGQDLFDKALQTRVSVAHLTDAMSRFRRAYGAPAGRAALDLASGGTVSRPERKLAAALRAAGLSMIRAGVRTSASGRPCWLDFAAPELRLAIEVDGFAAHTDPAVFKADRKRQNALVEDGWTVLRYTPWEIREELSRVVAEIGGMVTTLVGKCSVTEQIPPDFGSWCV